MKCRDLKIAKKIKEKKKKEKQTNPLKTTTNRRCKNANRRVTTGESHCKNLRRSTVDRELQTYASFWVFFVVAGYRTCYWLASFHFTMSSASTVSQSVSLPAPPTSNSAANGSSIPNLIPATSPVLPSPSFHVHQLLPVTPMVPGPPGMTPAPPVVSTSPAALFPPNDSASTILGPHMHATPSSINPSARPQIFGSYPSLTPVVSPPHGIWFQPPQLGAMPRPPFLPYSASYHGPLPFPARGMPLPSVPLPDPQPPGVTPVQVAPAIAVPAGHGNQLSGNSLIQTDSNHPQLGMMCAVK